MRAATAFYIGMCLVMGVTLNALDAPWWVAVLTAIYGVSNYVYARQGSAK